MAQVDVLNLELQKAQVEASIQAIGQKQNDAGPQIDILKEQTKSVDAQLATLQTQLEVLQKEQERVARLYKAEAATQQQMDDLKMRPQKQPLIQIAPESLAVTNIPKMLFVHSGIAMGNKQLLIKTAVHPE